MRVYSGQIQLKKVTKTLASLENTGTITSTGKVSSDTSVEAPKVTSATGSLILQGAGTSVLYVNSSYVTCEKPLTLTGNLQVNSPSTNSATCTITASTGALSAVSLSVRGTKNFEIPGESVGLPQGSKLRHACIESPYPENHYRLEVDAPEGESLWELPEYFDALNSQPQVWAAPVKHFSTAYGEVQGNTLHLFAQSAGKFNVLVIGRRSDPAVAGYVPCVAAPVPEP